MATIRYRIATAAKDGPRGRQDRGRRLINASRGFNSRRLHLFYAALGITQEHRTCPFSGLGFVQEPFFIAGELNREDFVPPFIVGYWLSASTRPLTAMLRFFCHTAII